MPQTVEQRWAAKRRRILRHAKREFFAMYGLEPIPIGCGFGRLGETGMFALAWDRYAELWPEQW